MNQSGNTLFRDMKKHISKRLLSGMLVLVPVGITLLLMRWLFGWAASLMKPAVMRILSVFRDISWVEHLPPGYINFSVSLLAILMLLALLYLVGALGQYVLGRKVIAAWEDLWLRIPLVKTVYGASRQVMQSFSAQDRTAFKSVVLVEFPRPGAKALGFLTGYILDSWGKRYAKVFIPTTPNPTTGFFEMFPADEVEILAMSVEDTFKMIISGGIVAPERLVRADSPGAGPDIGKQAEPSESSRP